MPISLVVSTLAQGTSSGVTSGGVDTTGANLLVLAVSYVGSPTISDSKGNTWTALTTRSSPVNAALSRLYYAKNPAVGSGHTFSASGSTTYASVALLAFSGADTSSPFDVENGAGSGANVNVLQPGSVTPATDGEVLVSALNINTASSSSEAIGSSFTISGRASIIPGTSFGIAMAYQIQTTATTRNPQWSWTASPNTYDAISAIAAFKAAVAFPPIPRPFSFHTHLAM